MGNGTSLVKTYKNFLQGNKSGLLGEESKVVDTIHDILCQTFFKNETNDKLIELTKELLFMYKCCSDKQYECPPLVVPYYQDDAEIIVRDYIILFMMLDNVCKQLFAAKEDDWKQHDDIMLFDPFSGKNDFLKLSREQDDQLIFGQDDIFVEKDQFIPLFQSSDVSGAAYLERSKIGHLFTAIIKLARMAQVDFPVVLKLRTEKTLVLTGKKQVTTRHRFLDRAFEINGFLYDTVNNGSTDNYKNIIGHLRESKVSTIVQLEWPYHRFDEPRYAMVLKPNTYLDIKLQRRFNTNLVDTFDGGLLFLPGELTSSDEYYDHSNIDKVISVINTAQVPELIPELDNLKASWNNSAGNDYNCPFPLKWLTLIHSGRPKEYWIKSYERTFPNVSPALRQQVNKIIDIIVEEDWLENIIQDILEKKQDTISMLLPRGRNYRSINQDLIEYLDQRLEGIKVNYIVHFDLLYNKLSGPVWVLDTNINVLFNLPKREGTELIVPIPAFHFALRFLYLKVQMLKITGNVLLGSETNPIFRKILLTDEQQVNISDAYRSALGHELKEARGRDRYYRPKVYIEDTSEVTPALAIDMDDALEEELHDEFNLARQKRTIEQLKEDTDELLVQLATKGQMHLKPDEFVLVRYNSIFMNIRARELKPGDKYATYKEILSTLNEVDDLFKSWTKFPETVNEWKKELKYLNDSIGAVYIRLCRRTKRFITSNQFESQWLNPDSIMMLPREKEHWIAVCGLLKIDQYDVERAWIAVRSEHKLEDGRWRRTKKEVLDLLEKHQFIGQLQNDEAINEIALILDKESYFKEKEIETKDVARILLNELTHALNEVIEFNKVERIVKDPSTQEANAI